MRPFEFALVTSAVHIRRLTPEDATAFQALRLAALLEAPTAFGSSYEEEREFSQSVIAGRLATRPDRGSFGAFEGNELVGLIGLGRESHRKLEHKALIWGMYVAPKARGKGVGRALLLEALALARGVPGIRQVNLFVNAVNKSAIRLYESAGFKVFGHEADAMLIDGELHDELHMRLPLSVKEESTMSIEQTAPETKGVTVELLATVDLGPEIEGMAGRQLRMRMVTIQPGGVFGPLHDHKDRPGTVYILQGTITDHRNGVATEYGPGVGWPEDRNTLHWLENRGTIPAVEISVDIVRQE